MKRLFLATATLCGIVLGVSIFTVPTAAQESDVKIGAAIAPVPLDLKGLNPALVRKGSYIVNAHGGCNDCHTNPPYAAGGDPFAGQPTQINAAAYLGGGTPFGPFTSRNLTPNASGRPAGLTLAQFKEVLKKGTDFKHAHPQISPLLQVMPWPVYGNMSDNDMEAVYEFLRAIPCLPSATNPNRCG